MTPLAAAQADLNRTTADRWPEFAAHRARVTELLLAAAPAGGRLCVLGAGNGNDLDLPALLRTYREVHLVDLDAEALARGTQRQNVADAPGLRLHGGIDVTGVPHLLSDWSPTSAVSPGDVAACTESPENALPSDLTGTFDVAASTGLLSQLISGVVGSVGERHPRFVELIQAVRAGHLRLLTRLLAPGGTGLLITDFVSSDSFPPLAAVPEPALPETLAWLVRQGNVFHGLHPAAVVSAFRTDPVLRDWVPDPELLEPWRWNLGPRCYAVFAVRFRTNAQVSSTP